MLSASCAVIKVEWYNSIISPDPERLSQDLKSGRTGGCWGREGASVSIGWNIAIVANTLLSGQLVGRGEMGTSSIKCVIFYLNFYIKGAVVCKQVECNSALLCLKWSARSLSMHLIRFIYPLLKKYLLPLDILMW